MDEAADRLETHETKSHYWHSLRDDEASGRQ